MVLRGFLLLTAVVVFVVAGVLVVPDVLVGARHLLVTFPAR